MGEVKKERAGENLRKRVFAFALECVRLHDRSDWRSARGVLTKQLLRAATSVGANLEEAAAGQSKADFTMKCRIALKEARESNYWLRLIAAAYEKEQVAELVNESHEIVSILTSIVKRSSSSDQRGR
jgi:four helix bundle protein